MLVEKAIEKKIQIPAELAALASAVGNTDTHMEANSNAHDKPLGTKRRNTFLTIIAALCNMGKIDIEKAGLAGRIARETEKRAFPCLMRQCGKNWPSAGILSSEAGVIFGSHGMGQESVMRNLGRLNALWDGGELSTGRRTSESFTVRGARLTIGFQANKKR